MTLKEICNNHSSCSTCPFLGLCTYMDGIPTDYVDVIDECITRAIIETAKELKENNNDD